MYLEVMLTSNCSVVSYNKNVHIFKVVFSKGILNLSVKFS